MAEHRHVGSNNFNLFSSRSHTIFTLVRLKTSLLLEYPIAYSSVHFLDMFYILF